MVEIFCFVTFSACVDTNDTKVFTESQYLLNTKVVKSVFSQK